MLTTIKNIAMNKLVMSKSDFAEKIFNRNRVEHCNNWIWPNLVLFSNFESQESELKKDINNITNVLITLNLYNGNDFGLLTSIKCAKKNVNNILNQYKHYYNITDKTIFRIINEAVNDITVRNNLIIRNNSVSNNLSVENDLQDSINYFPNLKKLVDKKVSNTQNQVIKQINKQHKMSLRTLTSQNIIQNVYMNKNVKNERYKSKNILMASTAGVKLELLKIRDQLYNEKVESNASSIEKECIILLDKLKEVKNLFQFHKHISETEKLMLLEKIENFEKLAQEKQSIVKETIKKCEIANREIDDLLGDNQLSPTDIKNVVKTCKIAKDSVFKLTNSVKNLNIQKKSLENLNIQIISTCKEVIRKYVEKRVIDKISQQTTKSLNTELKKETENVLSLIEDDVKQDEEKTKDDVLLSNYKLIQSTTVFNKIIKEIEQVYNFGKGNNINKYSIRGYPIADSHITFAQRMTKDESNIDSNVLKFFSATRDMLYVKKLEDTFNMVRTMTTTKSIVTNINNKNISSIFEINTEKIKHSTFAKLYNAVQNLIVHKINSEEVELTSNFEILKKSISKIKELNIRNNVNLNETYSMTTNRAYNKETEKVKIRNNMILKEIDDQISIIQYTTQNVKNTINRTMREKGIINISEAKFIDFIDIEKSCNVVIRNIEKIKSVVKQKNKTLIQNNILSNSIGNLTHKDQIISNNTLDVSHILKNLKRNIVCKVITDKISQVSQINLEQLEKTNAIHNIIETQLVYKVNKQDKEKEELTLTKKQEEVIVNSLHDKVVNTVLNKIHSEEENKAVNVITAPKALEPFSIESDYIRRNEQIKNTGYYVNKAYSDLVDKLKFERRRRGLS